MRGRERGADGCHGRKRPRRVVAFVPLLWAPRLLLSLLLSMFRRVMLLLLLLELAFPLLLLVALSFSLV